MNKNKKCSLFPYKMEEVLSIQQAKQQACWSITSFDLPKTWEKSRGEGVKIAVIDTGVDLTHPDLIKNLLPGINIINPNKLPIDDQKHGTHVAGILVAENNEIGMVGVAPESKVIPVKVLDRSGNGNLLNVAKGIRWSVDHGADILCMSLGSPSPAQEIRKAIQYAESKGVVCFVAAGNAGQTKKLYYPAEYPETIAIGSIDENFNRSDFSNTGESLDFMAPGGRIFSTIPKNWYGILSGTSMAAPFASGIAALLISYRRKKGLIPLKTANDFINEFKDHTLPITNSNLKDKKFFQGFGIIDPNKLFETLD